MSVFGCRNCKSALSHETCTVFLYTVALYREGEPLYVDGEGLLYWVLFGKAYFQSTLFKSVLFKREL